ncbi:beta-galactosidase [Clostridium sp. CAG:1013]|nr:beta-galactosidase [Clostridium sp. CAG:1013]
MKEFTWIGPGDDPVPMDWDGRTLDTGLFNDVLTATGEDAKVLARYGGDAWYAGEPALLETQAGKGRVLHFGGTLTRENVTAFLEYLGVLEPFGDLVQVPAACEIALRRKGEQEYLIVLNYGKEPQEILLKRPVVDLDDRCPVEGPVVLGSYETKVYRIGG